MKIRSTSFAPWQPDNYPSWSKKGATVPPDRYVCGFLGCEARPFNPLLGALPPLMRIRRAAGAASDLLDRLIDLTLTEVPADRPGAECIRLRLSELMFVEVVRGYLEMLPQEQTGWLAGLRDAAVGRAVALVHEIRRVTGQLKNSRAKPASRGRCLRPASCNSSGVHRCNISRDGACNWPHACSLMGMPRSRRSGVMSATSPTQPLAEALRGLPVSRQLSGAVARADSREKGGGISLVALNGHGHRPSHVDFGSGTGPRASRAYGDG